MEHALTITLVADKRHANACSLLLGGYLDLSTCDQLQEFMANAIEEGWRDITLDLGGIDYISSLGIGLLMEAMAVTEEKGGRLKFRNLSAKVRDVVEMLGVMLDVIDMQQQSGPQKPAVLVVDDDTDVRAFVKLALSALPCDVLEASTCREAMRLIEGNPNTVIVIADWMMPDRDGIDLLKEVKSRWPWIERILLTGVPKMTAAVKAMERGLMSRIITKPWDVAQMIRTVEALLKSGTRQLAAMGPKGSGRRAKVNRPEAPR